MNCPNCGAPNGPGQMTCYRCGTPLPGQAGYPGQGGYGVPGGGYGLPPKKKKGKIVAAILIPILLIGLGVGGFFTWRKFFAKAKDGEILYYTRIEKKEGGGPFIGTWNGYVNFSMTEQSQSPSAVLNAVRDKRTRVRLKVREDKAELELPKATLPLAVKHGDGELYVRGTMNERETVQIRFDYITFEDGKDAPALLTGDGKYGFGKDAVRLSIELSPISKEAPELTGAKLEYEASPYKPSRDADPAARITGKRSQESEKDGKKETPDKKAENQGGKNAGNTEKSNGGKASQNAAGAGKGEPADTGADGSSGGGNVDTNDVTRPMSDDEVKRAEEKASKPEKSAKTEAPAGQENEWYSLMHGSRWISEYHIMPEDQVSGAYIFDENNVLRVELWQQQGELVDIYDIGDSPNGWKKFATMKGTYRLDPAAGTLFMDVDQAPNTVNLQVVNKNKVILSGRDADWTMTLIRVPSR